MNSDHCSECACNFIETCTAGFHPLVGNGLCNDITNIAECNYDGGDCCGYTINREQCIECTCLKEETCAAGVHPWVGDGFCNDETNIAECNYDGGDCCPNPNIMRNDFCHIRYGACNYGEGTCCTTVNMDYCSDCICHGSGIITSPNYPGYYEENLDLTWLIQVQFGKLINITFLDFHIDHHPDYGYDSKTYSLIGCAKIGKVITFIAI